MTILKKGQPILNDAGKVANLQVAYDMYGLEGILAMLQKKEPSLQLSDLSVTSTTQSAIDGVEKMKRLGIYDDLDLRQEYLEIAKLGKQAEKLMAEYIERNSLNKTFKGKTYDVLVDCGFYVGNKEYPDEAKIPKKAKVIN